MIRLKTFGSIELRDGAGAPLVGDISRAKRLALLAYLGSQPAGRFLRRDTLMALFWPEADADRARHALRQALYILRQALGSDAILSRGEEELAVSADLVQVDAREFEACLAEGRDEDALALYTGEFLPGFHVPDASPELEEWLEQERHRFRGLAADVGWKLARAAASRGDSALATRRARWAGALAPLDEPAQRRLIEFLVQVGDRTGALLVYQQLSERLERELGTQPTRATRDLAESLRLRVSGPGTAPAATTAAAARPAAPVLAVETARPRRPALRWLWLVPALLVLVLLFARSPMAATGHPLLAVGAIERIGPTDTLLPPTALASLLATSVARLPGQRVLSSERIREVASELRERDGTAPGPAEAARQAGAGQLIEGTLSRVGDSVRLALRVTDLHSGLVLHVAEAQASNPFVLVDRATEELARQYGVSAPATGIAAVTTTSPEAFGLYQEGLRRYYDNDLRPALALFQSALARDSSFAMAAFFAWRTAHMMEDTSSSGLAPVAMRLSGRMPDADRLWIRSELLQGVNSPTWVPLAESLAVRNPANLDGIMLAGDARNAVGDFLGAIPFYRRVAQEDSLTLGRAGRRCRACEARQAIVWAYEWADSVPAAVREAAGWHRRQPRSISAASLLWEALRREASIPQARALGDSISDWLADPSDGAMRRAVLGLEQWNFAESDPALISLIRSGGKGYRESAIMSLAISLRAQGRPAAALRLVAGRQLPDGSTIPGNPAGDGLLPYRGVALIEAGQAQAAAALFDSVAARPPDDPGGAARHVSWNLTHLATALAAVGDTSRLASIAETIARASEHSSYGRDRRLTFYVRGLLTQALGDTAAARDLFARSLYSRTEGYAQISYRLAQCELALGQPTRAIELLEAVNRGPLDSGNLYLNRSQAALLLARAFAAAGQVDSARAEYRLVARALEHAEAGFEPEHHAALEWLRAHGEPRP
jgi:DNA-binding SARP family transcriptional activator